ncbi:MAG: alanine--tRNA ligase [Desulfomonile tiedjei]|nr:alanine--tRNA ligase [Desulfomonile tiedjei]
MTGAELREKFLEYFEERSHVRLPSSSLIPSGDATLLFTNAGMVQFKSIFTGEEKRPFNRAVTAQKCLRVSGKHNDLENVGHTARHHTFFEMLGNFSFGDYFKKDAIAFGWEFLTEVVGLPKEQLHVTVYRDDDEALELWRKVLGPNANPIGKLGEKDNFWSMGDTGPCGPCSEIHIDLGEEVGCGRPDCAPGCDCDRFLELWNLVFMQFERDSSGKMTALPKPSIDTGLGLERLAAVVQGVKSNWESDLFRPIILRIEELSGKECKGRDLDSIAIRVIADHSRAAAFLISDGVLPSNEGRGYVLRRILRRAIRYGKFIGLNEPFLYDTSRVVVENMSSAYPELETHAVLVEKVIRNEEERFLETLARGLILFEEEAKRVRGRGEKVLPGDVAFRLYDTYGFPPDLTTDLAREAGLVVDNAGFDAAMAGQRAKARQSWDGMKGENGGHLRGLVDQGIATEFTGYETLDDTGIIKVILKDGEQVLDANPGERVEVITDRTPFYGESGGQVGDRGIIGHNGDQILVEDTQKPIPTLIVHRGLVKAGSFRVGDKVNLKVDEPDRRSIMSNHSATHLLQWALREVLGDHVKQSGSLVEAQRLRFDFTHFSSISPEELARVEDLVNRKIQENVQVQATTMSMTEATGEGAIALFGEKYGDTVRMVSMGDFSKELCGGTHTRRTGDIGLFKITSEGGIAAGVRRIEAVTGRGSLDYVRSLENELGELAEHLRGSRGELVRRLDKLIEEKKAKEREVEVLKAKLAAGVTRDILEGVREVGGVKVLAQVVEDVSNPKDLREYADRVKDRLGSGVALLGAEADGKALLIALVTKDLTKRFNAGEIAKKAAIVLGGSGGGRRDMAQAGGPNVAALGDALKTIDEFVTP